MNMNYKNRFNCLKIVCILIVFIERWRSALSFSVTYGETRVGIVNQMSSLLIKTDSRNQSTPHSEVFSYEVALSSHYSLVSLQSNCTHCNL